MLTTNVDISDRLINGQLSTVIKVSVDNVSNKLYTIFVKFDDSNAGISAIRNSSSCFARENNLVPIKPVYWRELKSDKENHHLLKCKDYNFL
jgi:hypothetical protein